MKSKKEKFQLKKWKFSQNTIVKMEEEAIRNFSSSSSGFDFWNNSKENIYQDYLKNSASLRLCVQ